MMGKPRSAPPVDLGGGDDVVFAISLGIVFVVLVGFALIADRFGR